MASVVKRTKRASESALRFRESAGPPRRRDRVRGVEVSSVALAPGGPAPPHEASGPIDVVLVHGLAVSNRYLVPAARRLAADRRVFAPDLPGVGRSSGAGRRLGMAELADGLVDWMDAVGVGSATLVGHSLGCQLVALLAARHPARVRAAVLVSPGRDPDQASLLQQAWRLLVDGPRELPSMVRIAAQDYLRVGASRMLRTIREAGRSDAAVSLARLRQPTLVVRGDCDPLVSAPWAERLTRSLPAGSLATITGAPHGVPYSAVEPFVDEVRRFLARIDLG